MIPKHLEMFEQSFKSLFYWVKPVPIPFNVVDNVVIFPLKEVSEEILKFDMFLTCDILNK